MDQLINNLQAALAALRAAKPNPSQWSGPAANAFTTRIDLLEIEFVVISSLLSAASLGGLVGGGVPGIPGGGKLPGGILGGLPIGASPVIPLNTLMSQLGLHF